MNTHNLNLSPEHKQKLNEAFSRHLGEIMAAQEMMDEKQIFACFVQALEAGDFVKQVMQGSGAQNFIYQPFREATELREKYNELIMAVMRNVDGETRHQTALRYINEAETKNMLECADKINNWIDGKE